MAEANPNEIWLENGWMMDGDYIDELLDDFLDEFEFSPYE